MMKFLYLYPHASPLRCQYESPSPLLFTQNKHRADGYCCIHVGLLTNIVILLITSPRSHPFEIFRAKRLFGVSAFCNSALIRLQMENLTACPSIIYYPFLASESCYNRCNYGPIIGTGNKHASLYVGLCKLLLLFSGEGTCFDEKDMMPCSYCVSESHIVQQ